MPTTNNQYPNVDLIPMPDIGTSEECSTLYQDFNTGIASLQTKKEGQTTLPLWLENSIKNISYTLASPIVRQIGGAKPTEPQLAVFVKKAGDSMNGNLNANNGFSAGLGNIPLLQIKEDKDKSGVVLDRYVDIKGKLKITSDNLYIDNKVLFNHFTRANDNKEVLEVNGGDLVDFKSSSINIGGDLIANKLKVSPTSFTYSGNVIYHAGNSNSKDHDWIMRNGTVHGELNAMGKVTVGNKLIANNGVELGSGGNPRLTIGVDTKNPNDIMVSGDINLNSVSKFKIAGKNVISSRQNDLLITGIGGHIHLGGGESGTEIMLHNTLSAEGGNDLIDRFGAATFMNSFKAGFGNDGISLVETVKDGALFNKSIIFQDKTDGVSISGNPNDLTRLDYSALYKKGSASLKHTSSIRVADSISRYTLPDTNSQTLFIDTSTDFINYNKPVEASGHIGVSNSKTRLTDTSLFFNERHKLQDFGGNSNYFFSSGGINHYGDAIFQDNIFSPRFSTGFAGEGFCIRKKQEDGNYEITTDYLFVRKKFTTYELEVQKINVINGSLWVSSSCSGDTVQQIQ